MEETEEEPIDDLPPGFKSFDEYVSDGGDPDMYRGRKAYEAEHTRIDENKRLRKDVKGLQSTVQQTMDAVSDWQSTERDKMKRELQAELHTAKENEDVNAAIDAQQRLDKLAEEPQRVQQDIEPPVIQQFREDNPMIDSASDDYDEEFNGAVEGFYNTIYNQISQNGHRRVSDNQVQRCLDKAMRDARDLHGLNEPNRTLTDDPPTESPRNLRKRGQRQPRRQQQSRQPITARAEEFKIDNPKNGRDTSGAGVRDMIREKAFKNARKGGKSEVDATLYAEQETKRFEESLAR